MEGVVPTSTDHVGKIFGELGVIFGEILSSSYHAKFNSRFNLVFQRPSYVATDIYVGSTLHNGSG